MGWLKKLAAAARAAVAVIGVLEQLVAFWASLRWDFATA